MSRAEELQAALDALNVEMVAKLGLEPGDDWTDFCSDNDEPLARSRHKSLLNALDQANGGVRPIAPS